MCFSATASFSASAVLLGIGTLTLRSARRPRELPFAAATMTLFLVSTALSPVLSTHRLLRVFGVLALSSFAAAYAFYATWFISVWCFFAALLSAVIYIQIALRGRENLEPVRAGIRPTKQPFN